MSQPSDKLLREFEHFVNKLQTRGTQLARGGAYSRASEYIIAARALEKWVEDGLEGAMDSENEAAYERIYRPE